MIFLLHLRFVVVRQLPVAVRIRFLHVFCLSPCQIRKILWRSDGVRQTTLQDTLQNFHASSVTIRASSVHQPPLSRVLCAQQHRRPRHSLISYQGVEGKGIGTPLLQFQHARHGHSLHVQHLVQWLGRVLHDPSQGTERFSDLRQGYQHADDLRLTGHLQPWKNDTGAVAETRPLIERHGLQNLSVARRRLDTDYLAAHKLIHKR
mmetsp:Transcript_65182/g.172697  ORF Transcript_65182/g.172697 Transcript_65182/m.172697 type:complete len:205 (+) Transcript_65182:257-871(+)